MPFTVITGTDGPNTVTIGASQSGKFDIRTLGGNDTIKLLRSDDLGGGHKVDAGSGNDTVLNLFEGNNVIVLGSGNDTYLCNGFTAFNESDVVSGNAGNDTFGFSTFMSTYNGGDNDDLFISDGWQNVINGGPGSDTVSYQDRALNSAFINSAVTVDLAAQKVATGASRIETLSSIENAKGSAKNDLLFGNSGNNKLTGLAGDDGIDGAAGNDTLEGGLGHDELLGGAGADKFVYYHLRNDSGDQIDDFNPAQGDKIELKNGAPFGGLTVGAFSNSGQLKVGANPVPNASKPTLLYDTDTGILSMDPDGTGAKAKVEFIQFVGVPTLHASDFHVF
ncbi:calcium-binding protein [Oryzibacter oryziterrae]|uniref:calcium-binding protein n=1 Tax=Oryzibacter oryziterrae TaxID=2766474 RepID=UPI00272CB83B|nr:calcium-binding protein [Oryzibacter oryziterrae]